MYTKNFHIEHIEKNNMPNKGLYYYIMKNVRTKKKELPIKNFYGQYYPINLNAQYVHFLVDGIGGFLQMKKKYPNLKPIFFITNNNLGNPNKKANYEILKIINAEILDITNENCYFEELITPHSFLSPIPFTEFYMHLEYEIDITELFNNPYGSDVWYCNSSKELNLLLNNNNKTFLEKNIYVSRSKINQKSIDTNTLMSRIHPTEYDIKLDKIMEELGYEVVFTEDLGLFEQIELFNKARNVVAITGSSLFNAIWCNKDANIIEIKLLPQYNFYWKEILKATGKRLSTIKCFDNNHNKNLEYIKKKILNNTI